MKRRRFPQVVGGLFLIWPRHDDNSHALSQTPDRSFYRQDKIRIIAHHKCPIKGVVKSIAQKMRGEIDIRPFLFGFDDSDKLPGIRRRHENLAREKNPLNNFQIGQSPQRAPIKLLAFAFGDIAASFIDSGLHDGGGEKFNRIQFARKRINGVQQRIRIQPAVPPDAVFAFGKRVVKIKAVNVSADSHIKKEPRGKTARRDLVIPDWLPVTQRGVAKLL